MTYQKTKSLTLALNPVARMRELADLDNPPAPPEVPNDSNAATEQHGNDATHKPSSEATPPQSSAQALEQDNVETQKPEGAGAQPQGNAETQQHRNAATKKRSSTPAQPELDTAQNPVREAMRQALMQAYSVDLSKGPSTATTIRIPTEIWERLDMASSLEGQTKQDIIAEALKQYLTKIGRGQA